MFWVETAVFVVQKRSESSNFTSFHSLRNVGFRVRRGQNQEGGGLDQRVAGGGPAEQWPAQPQRDHLTGVPP